MTAGLNDNYMDLSQLIDRVVNTLLPHFESEKNIEALQGALPTGGAARRLWDSLRNLLVGEFDEGGQLDESIADPQVLKFVLKRGLRNDPPMQNRLIAVLKTAEEKSSQKNTVRNSEIEAGQNVHIGDKGEVEPLGPGSKNRIEGSVIKAGGNVHVGDQTILHQDASGPDSPIAAQVIKVELSNLDQKIVATLADRARQLIAKGKVKHSIGLLVDFSRQHRLKNLETEVAGFSARFEDLNRQKQKGLLSAEEATRISNRITDAVLELLKDF